MKSARELSQVSPRHRIWWIYDRAVKAELFSTAIDTDCGVVVIDPIPLIAEVRVELGEVAAVLLTNANHARAASEFADSKSLFVPPALKDHFPGAQTLADGAKINGLSAIAIDGAAPGEFAFHDPHSGGTLIVGDALINFGPHGFELLPAKYCENRRQMIRSLRRLLDLSFTNIFFAHGQPIVKNGRDRLAALLDESS